MSPDTGRSVYDAFAEIPRPMTVPAFPSGFVKILFFDRQVSPLNYLFLPNDSTPTGKVIDLGCPQPWCFFNSRPRVD